MRGYSKHVNNKTVYLTTRVPKFFFDDTVGWWNENPTVCDLLIFKMDLFIF